MGKIHDSAIRYGDEFQCSTCGKAWSVDDADIDIPSCEIRLDEPLCDDHKLQLTHMTAQVIGLKQMIVECGSPHEKRFNWSPLQWYNHLNIIKLRDTINTHK